MGSDSEPAQPMRNVWGDDPPTEEEFFTSHGVDASSSSFPVPGDPDLRLFTRLWRPAPPRVPRALICVVHGYGNDTGWTFQFTALFLARAGFAVAAADLPGHGRSSGLRGFVPDIDAAVASLAAFFRHARARHAPALPAFLWGESMGGAIALLLHLSAPQDKWAGAVLIAPMCKISDRIRPPWPLPEILTLVARFAPTAPIVPTADLIEKSIKVPEKRRLAAANPMRYTGRPRLGTVTELLRATDHLATHLQDVTIPFIVLHGSADEVTDPEVSQALHKAAASTDKTIQIYEGMLHSLLFGEPDENIELVRADILEWLNRRCPAATEVDQA